MKILSRYVLKEFLGNLALGLLVFTFILLLDRLFELVDILLRKGVGIWITTKLMVFLLPSTLMLTLPMSFLLASLLTYGRLSEHNEITALKASGLAPWSLMRGVVAAAGLAVAVLLPFNAEWAPRMHSKFRQIYVEVLHRNPLVRIEEKTFIQVGDYHLFVQRKSRDKELRGITIYRMSSDGAPIRIFASRGRASVDPVRGVRLDLKEVRIEQVDPQRPGQWFNTLSDAYSLSIPFRTTAAPQDRSLEELTNRELAERIRTLNAQGTASTLLISQRHLRLALAVTPLLFVLLAVPLASRLHRGGRSIGFGLSLAVAIGYYLLLLSFTGLGQRGVLPTALSVWVSNALLAILGGWLLVRFHRVGG